MIRVKMRTRYASPRGCCEPGAELLVSKEEAEALIASRHAEPVVESAARAPAENAASRPARSRVQK